MANAKANRSTRATSNTQGVKDPTSQSLGTTDTADERTTTDGRDKDRTREGVKRNRSHNNRSSKERVRPHRGNRKNSHKDLHTKKTLKRNATTGQKRPKGGARTQKEYPTPLHIFFIHKQRLNTTL
jgi:hypothetical protein